MPLVPSARDKSKAPRFCDRWSTELVSGTGDFYVVKVETAADPHGEFQLDSYFAK
ncbi:MAG: hypothetical protein HYV60_07995 [Planctomycetia bacterium]|nr:hypothetical protein [Planctomycetia bacterium]